MPAFRVFTGSGVCGSPAGHDHFNGGARGMRIRLSFLVLVIVWISGAGPAFADVLAPHWISAREKWNAVADRAIAGDGQAKMELQAAVDACAPDTECYRNRGQVPEAERLRVQAAWKACADTPGRIYPLSPEQALDRCRRNLTTLNVTQIDAAAAAVNIGWILSNGKLGEIDTQSGYDYYAFAAEFDHPMGHHSAGVLIMSGKLGTPDIGQAATHYLKAGRLGLVAGWIALGELREKHGAERPFTDMFFVMSAREGVGSALRYNDPAFFYRRARLEDPSEAQQQKIEEKLASFTANAPKPVAAEPAPAPEPVKPALREATLVAARDCMSRADELKRMKSEHKRLTRELKRLDEGLDETERHLRTVYNYAPEAGSPAAAARNWNYDEFDRKVAEYNRRAEDVNAYADDIDRLVNRYNAACGKAGVSLTKPEYEAVCGGRTGNDFCKGFNFQ